MSETTFRLARLGEDAAIIDFINDNFDMRLPLLNRPELYHHYYAGRGGVPQFAVAEEDGRYVSAAGYILANTRRKPDIWVSVWVAAKGHNGVGLELMNALPGAAAQGLAWGIMAIGVYITFRILDVADLTVDGSLATGGAVCVMLIRGGFNPWIALLCAMLAGMLAGLVTGLFHTRCGIPAILAGILTQLALYSINLRIMDSKANQALSVDKYPLLLSQRYVRELSMNNPLPLLLLFTAAVIAILYWFFGTEKGSSLRATGANPHMARAQGINTNSNIVLGLMVSNGLVALSGALLAQYQGSSDINMGRGAIVIGLAAVVIGKALLGKRKNFALRLLTTALGAVAYYFILAIVIWAGLSTTDLKLFSALVVTVFLAIPYLRKKWAAHHHAKGGSAVC